MEKLRIHLKRWRYKIRSRIPALDIPLETVVSILLLLAILAFLGGNLWRRVQEGSQTYEVYVKEQQALDLLEKENEQLKRELNYYQSAEFQLLYARDSLNQVRSGETLYQLETDPKIYSYQPEKVQLTNQIELHKLWWYLLFD